jgi:hypothetical protein
MTRPPRFHFVPTETRPITQPYRQQKEVRSVPPGPKSDVALAIRDAALDPAIIKGRQELAAFTGSTFNTVGIELQVFGHLLGPDRKSGTSPFGHGNDAAVAVAMLLQIGSQLISGGAELIGGGRHYAGAALIRQLVEIEYLAWAFEAKNGVAAQWLRSDHIKSASRSLRQQSFARLRRTGLGVWITATIANLAGIPRHDPGSCSERNRRYPSSCCRTPSVTPEGYGTTS